MVIETLKPIARELALAALKIGAIKIRPEDPFLWASGTYNPIYNDNRMLLWYPAYRRLVLTGFMEVVKHLHETDAGFAPTFIAGTSTAGIPPATLLAHHMKLPLIYIRDEPKNHGMKNQIEGIDADMSLWEEGGPVIEDLISTGKSSVKAVQAVRNAKGEADYCFSIFNYGLPKAQDMFAGKIPFGPKREDILDKPCKVISLLDYPLLLAIGIEEGFIKKNDEAMLIDWMNDQDSWGDNHGFPRNVK